MDDNGFSIANRDEPIPVITVTDHLGEDRAPSSTSGKRAHLRSKSQDALSRVGGKVMDEMDSSSKQAESSNSMQDRLLNLYVVAAILSISSSSWELCLRTGRLLSQVIPTDGNNDSDKFIDRRSRKYVDRPNFSVGAMSNNFRRFNARI